MNFAASLGLNALTVFSRFHSSFKSLSISNSDTSSMKSTSKTSFMSWTTENMIFHVKCFVVSLMPPYLKLFSRLWSDMRQSSFNIWLESPSLPQSIWRKITVLSNCFVLCSSVNILETQLKYTFWLSLWHFPVRVLRKSHKILRVTIS